MTYSNRFGQSVDSHLHTRVHNIVCFYGRQRVPSRGTSEASTRVTYTMCTVIFDRYKLFYYCTFKKKPFYWVAASKNQRKSGQMHLLATA